MRTRMLALCVLLLVPAAQADDEVLYAKFLDVFQDNLLLEIEGEQTLIAIHPSGMNGNFMQLFRLQIRKHDLLKLTKGDDGRLTSFELIDALPGEEPPDPGPGPDTPDIDEVDRVYLSLRPGDRVFVNGVEGTVAGRDAVKLMVQVGEVGLLRVFDRDRIDTLRRVGGPVTTDPPPVERESFTLASLDTLNIQTGDRLVVNDQQATLLGADSLAINVRYIPDSTEVEIEWQWVTSLRRAGELVQVDPPPDSTPVGPSQVLEVITDAPTLDYENNEWQLEGTMRFQPGDNEFVAVGARIALQIAGTGTLLRPDEEREAINKDPELSQYRVWEDGQGGLVLAWKVEETERKDFVIIPLDVLLPGDEIRWTADPSDTRLAELNVVSAEVILAENDGAGNGKWVPQDRQAGEAIVQVLAHHESLSAERRLRALRLLLKCEKPVGIDAFLSFLGSDEDEVVDICMTGLEQLARGFENEQGELVGALGDRELVAAPIYELLTSSDPILRLPYLTPQGLKRRLTAHPILVRKRLWQLLTNIDPAKGRLLGLEILAGLHPHQFPVDVFRRTILSYFEAEEFQSAQFAAFRLEGYRVGASGGVGGAANEVLDELGARAEGALRELWVKIKGDEVPRIPSQATPEEVVQILREDLKPGLRDYASVAVLEDLLATAETQVRSGSLEDAVAVYRDATSLSGHTPKAKAGLAAALVALARQRIDEQQRWEAHRMLKEARDLKNPEADELYGQVLYLVAAEMEMGVWVHDQPDVTGVSRMRLIKDVQTFDKFENDFPTGKVEGWFPVRVGADSIGWISESVALESEDLGIGVKVDSYRETEIEAAIHAVLDTKSSFAAIAEERKAALIAARAETLFLNGEWEQARDQFDAALARNPNDPVASYYIKFCYVKQYVDFVLIIGGVLAGLIALSFFSLKGRSIARRRSRMPEMASGDMPFSELHAGRWLTSDTATNPRIGGDGGFNISGPMPGAHGQSGSLGVSKPLPIDYNSRPPRDFNASGPLSPEEEESWAQSSGYGDEDSGSYGSEWSSAGDDTGSGPTSWTDEGARRASAPTQNWENTGSGAAAAGDSWSDSSTFEGGGTEGAADASGWDSGSQASPGWEETGSQRSPGWDETGSQGQPGWDETGSQGQPGWEETGSQRSPGWEETGAQSGGGSWGDESSSQAMPGAGWGAGDESSSQAMPGGQWAAGDETGSGPQSGAELSTQDESGEAWTEGGTFGRRKGGKKADPYDSGGQEEETGPIPGSPVPGGDQAMATGPASGIQESSGAVTNAVLLDRYEQLQERRASFPDDPEVYVQLGQVCEDLNRLDEAIGFYTTAAELNPDDPYPKEQLARLHPDGHAAADGLSRSKGGLVDSFVRGFAYPLHGNGLISLAIGTVLMTGIAMAMNMPMAMLIIGGIALGYFSAFFFSIVKASGLGKHEAPDWPDIGDWIGYALHVAMFSFVAGWPALLVAALACYFPSLWFLWIVFGLVVPLVMFYMPMALLSSIMHNTVTVAADLKLTFQSIGNCVGHYFAYYAVLCVTTGLYVGIGAVTKILAGMTGSFLVSMLVAVLMNAFAVYMLMFNGYLLGQIYHMNENKIGWFK